MAETVNIVGETDGKPLDDQMKHQLTTALRAELQKQARPGVTPTTHHTSITHISISFA